MSSHRKFAETLFADADIRSRALYGCKPVGYTVDWQGLKGVFVTDEVVGKSSQSQALILSWDQINKYSPII